MMICDSWDFPPPPPPDGGGSVDLGRPPPATTEAEFVRLFKRTAGLCKTSNETCGDWGQRIIANYCTRAGVYVSICNGAVYQQIGVGCPDVTCP